jgi:glutaredoxin-related protein
MSRPILEEHALHPAIRAKVAELNVDVLGEVRAAVAKHQVVVVGMAQNPFVRKARKALEAAGVAFEYLEYGSYLSQWHRRASLKMWSGWPTFPMVFVRGVLVGGANDLARLIESGELAQRLADE